MSVVKLAVRRWRGAARDLGMATAEYAVAMLAAVAFAAGLFTVVTSGEVRGLLLNIIKRALQLGE